LLLAADGAVTSDVRHVSLYPSGWLKVLLVLCVVSNYSFKSKLLFCSLGCLLRLIIIVLQ
jgi:hypothetical protein